jgi:V/A-type H+-transporting ATPase subunit I
MNDEVEKAIESKKANSDLGVKLSMQLENLKVWGDFSPSMIEELGGSGIPLSFYRMGKKELSMLSKDQNVKFIRLSPVEKMETVAVIGDKLPRSFPATEFVVPEKGISELQEELDACRAEIEKADAVLTAASRELATYKSELKRCQNEIEFSSVERTSQSDEDLVWLSGYVPEAESKAFSEAAKKFSWAYAIEDISDDDEYVPTKVKYSKVSALMEPVFGILGTVPGYREYDISFWFLCFF